MTSTKSLPAGVPGFEIILQELFPGSGPGGDAWQDAFVVGVSGNPRGPGARAGFGSGGRWRDLDDVYKAGLAEQNAYVAVSQFGVDPAAGRVRRVQHLAQGQYFLGVDDVVSKGDAAVLRRLLGDPTLAIETSPGNEQWFYVLDAPELDPGRMHTLVCEVIVQAFAGKDPGMTSATRLLRLPGGLNQKPALTAAGGVGFRVVVTQWAPGKRFNIEALAQGLGFTLPGPGIVRPQGTRAAVPSMGWDGDDVFEELSLAGLVIRPTTAGDGVQVLCPNAGVHSDGDGQGAAYFKEGGFKCHHGHCVDFDRDAVADWANERRMAREGTGIKGRWFPPVVDTSVGGEDGPAGDAARRFLEELVYVGREDRFLSLRTREVLSSEAVNMMFTARLAAAGVTPMGRRGGRMSAVEWWLSEANLAWARRVDMAIYWPGRDAIFRDEDVTYVNEWFQPVLGRPVVAVSDADVMPWLRVVWRVCQGEAPWVVDHLLDWFAMAAWGPAHKPGHHPLVISEVQGLGKDLAALPVRYAVGERNVGHMTAAALEGQFNSWLRSRLVVCQEIRQGLRGGTEIYNKLKEITDNTVPWLRVNSKNRPEYRVRNLMCFYLTSNHDTAAAIEKADRRFFVLVAAGAVLPDADERAAEAQWMVHGGGQALCAQWLRQRWEAMSADRIAALEGHAPLTEGRARLWQAVEPAAETYVREAIESRWPDLMTMEDIRADAAAVLRAGTAGFKVVPSAHRLGALLRGLGGAKVYGGNVVELPDPAGGQPRRAKLWATRQPLRFAGMGEAAIAQAYKSAKRHTFGGAADNMEEFPF